MGRGEKNGVLSKTNHYTEDTLENIYKRNKLDNFQIAIKSTSDFLTRWKGNWMNEVRMIFSKNDADTIDVHMLK